MTTIEEWQLLLDKDFPYGAVCHKETDVNDLYPWSFRTACLTIYGLEDNNPKLMFFNADVDGYDFRLVFDTYTITRTEPVLQATITCLNKDIWTFAAAISEEIGRAWAGRRAYDRQMALYLGQS